MCECVCHQRAALCVTDKLLPIASSISIVHRKLNSIAGKPFNWPDKASICHREREKTTKRGEEEEERRREVGQSSDWGDKGKVIERRGKR